MSVDLEQFLSRCIVYNPEDKIGQETDGNSPPSDQTIIDQAVAIDQAFQERFARSVMLSTVLGRPIRVIRVVDPDTGEEFLTARTELLNEELSDKLTY